MALNVFQMMMLAGKGGPSDEITLVAEEYSYTSYGAGPILGSSGIRLNVDGSTDSATRAGSTGFPSTFTPNDDWNSNEPNPEETWHVRASWTTGTNSPSIAGSATSSWLALSTARTWYITESFPTPRTYDGDLSLEFSRDGGSSTAATIAIGLTLVLDTI